MVYDIWEVIFYIWNINFFIDVFVSIDSVTFSDLNILTTDFEVGGKT